VVVEISLLFCIDDNDCIADLPIANLFLMSQVQLPSLVKIEPKYTNDSTSSSTSPLRLIIVLIYWLQLHKLTIEVLSQTAQTSAGRQHNRIAESFLQCKLG